MHGCLSQSLDPSRFSYATGHCFCWLMSLSVFYIQWCHSQVCVCVSGVLWFEKESTFINIYLYFKELWLKVIEVDHIFALENMELTGRLRRQTPGLGSFVQAMHKVAFWDSQKNQTSVHPTLTFLKQWFTLNENMTWKAHCICSVITTWKIWRSFLSFMKTLLSF